VTRKNVGKADNQQAGKPKLPKFRMRDDGVCNVVLVDEDQVGALFGGTSEQFGSALLSHCVNVSGGSEALSSDKEHAVAIVGEIAPQDGIEALLATQMAAIHIATMRHSRLMAGADIIERLELQERVFNKLARTFTTQMEALRKHRSGGKQIVRVERVNVESGGQAIVGDVMSHGGEGRQ
jgi:hypothetical protein